MHSHVTGTIYSSSLFPNRAPDGRVLLLNYIGGSTNTEILAKVIFIPQFRNDLSDLFMVSLEKINT